MVVAVRGFISFYDFFNDIFLDLKKQEVRQTTINNYLSVVKNLKELKYKNILFIREKHIVEELSHYSNAHKHSVLKTLSVIFDVAKKKKYRFTNPCKTIKVHRYNKAQINIFSKHQIKNILTAAKENKNLYLCILLAAYGGLRRGEIAGLKLSDIDFKDCTISITKQIVQSKGGSYISELKTRNSARKIKISDFVLKEIKKYGGNEFVISGKKYDYVSPNWITNSFHNILKELNIENLRFHDLRVTHATFLIANGVDIKTVSKRLGHANTSVTLEIYTSYLQSTDTKCVKILDNLMVK